MLLAMSTARSSSQRWLPPLIVAGEPSPEPWNGGVTGDGSRESRWPVTGRGSERQPCAVTSWHQDLRLVLKRRERKGQKTG